MINFFNKGGILMWPILLCSVAAIAVIIERVIFFLVHKDRTPVIKQAQTEIAHKKFSKAAGLLENSSGSLAVFLSTLLAARDLPKYELTAQAIVSGDEILLKMRRGLFVLTLVERTAPMIGFLGTVIGMILTFVRVAAADGPVHPGELADGIWQALVTTAGGLAVAIPVLVAHHLFDTYISHKAAQLKKIGETSLIFIHGKKK